MNEKIEQLVGYIQQRCLWQFFSRSWDREENIEGILTKAGQIFAGEEPSLETNMDRCFYADARILVADFRTEFPWIREEDSSEIKSLLEGVKERLRFIAIEGSHNGELNMQNY